MKTGVCVCCRMPELNAHMERFLVEYGNLIEATSQEDFNKLVSCSHKELYLYQCLFHIYLLDPLSEY